MRDGYLKITYFFKDRTYEMYDLKADPKEENNLFDPQDPRSREMAERLRQWYLSTEREGSDMPPLEGPVRE